MSDKEDSSLSLCAVYNEHNPYVRMAENTAQRETIHPDKLTNDIGHWQEYPKNQNYERRGYYLKLSKHKRLRKTIKAKMLKEIEE